MRSRYTTPSLIQPSSMATLPDAEESKRNWTESPVQWGYLIVAVVGLTLGIATALVTFTIEVSAMREKLRATVVELEEERKERKDAQKDIIVRLDHISATIVQLTVEMAKHQATESKR